MRPRIALVCLITAALLAAAGWAGTLDVLPMADRVHSLPLVGGVLALALGYAWWGKWEAVGWLVLLMPFCGLVLTSFGILETFPEALAGADYNTMRAHTIAALTPNCIAGAAVVWLLILRRICEPR